MGNTYFKRLLINEWKQFTHLDIEFHDKLTILTGANGSGKTTILNLLAKHFGWDFLELSTPAKDEETGIFRFFNRFFKKNEKKEKNEIGSLTYSDSQNAKILIPNNDSAQYQLSIKPQIGLNGINILSHRPVFRYTQVANISTQKRSKQQAFKLSKDSSYYSFFSNGGPPTNYYIKETLLNWAIGGSGNEFIEADIELKNNFLGFEKVLKTLLPKNIGFQHLLIRNYELVLETSSGDFMLDAVSGGVSNIIDLAWQIYNFAEKNNEKIVVLIDEVENHLHATMQRAILPDLINAFPNIQFIVSTHSPLIIGSVKDSNVYAFRYDEKNKVYQEKLDLINKAKTATEILNEVLGVPFSMPIWVEDSLNNIISKYSAKELDQNSFSNMRAELKSMGLENLMPQALQKTIGNRK